MKRYRAIVADPPWPLPPTGPRSGGSPKGWGRAAGERAVVPYTTMSLAEIAALPVAELADPAGCHLYLWTINRFLPDAFEVAAAWGFKFSTLLTWCKPPRGKGLGGAYTLTTEHVLFCRRGTLAATTRLLRTPKPIRVGYVGERVDQPSRRPDAAGVRPLADRKAYDAPGAGAAQRCLWCGRESSGTRGRRSALVPVPAGMRAWLAVHAPELCHAQLGATSPSWWWCRSVPGCIRRQGGGS